MGPVQINKHAFYKGVRVFLCTERDGYFSVLTDPGIQLSNDFMEDMIYNGHTEYYGRIQKGDPRLTVIE